MQDDPSKIDAVLFDYGLVLTGPPLPDAWQAMQRVLGVDAAALQAAYWTPRDAYDRGTHSGGLYWRLVGEHAGRSPKVAEIAELIALDGQLWTVPNPAMIDWTARLQAGGTRTGILSNLGDEMTRTVLERMPWLAKFTHKTFSYTLRLAKPEDAIYQAAIAGLGVPAQNVLFIDDRADNCEGGRRAGMQVIQYAAHNNFVAEMEERGYSGLWLNGC